MGAEELWEYFRLDGCVQSRLAACPPIGAPKVSKGRCGTYGSSKRVAVHKWPCARVCFGKRADVQACPQRFRIKHLLR